MRFTLLTLLLLLVVPSAGFAKAKKFDASGNVIRSSWGSSKHKSSGHRGSKIGSGMKSSEGGGSDLSKLKALKKKKKEGEKKKCVEGSEGYAECLKKQKEKSQE